MSPITPRLRLTAAALTIAAALSGAFLVSSAPAQTAAPTPAKPGALVGIWAATDKPSSSLHEIVIFGPRGEGIETTPGSFPRQYFRYAIDGSNITVTLTHIDNNGKTALNPPPQSKTVRFSIVNGTLAIFSDPGNAPKTVKRISDYPEGASLDAVTTQQAALFHAPPLPTSQTSLDQAQFLAGLTPVQGPGVVVTLTDSKRPLPAGLPTGLAAPSLIHDSDINQVVNELKAAGAEAISVNGQRLVATSFVRSAGPTVMVNSTLQASPFVIQAIGDPKTLLSAMTLPGGVATQLKVFDPAMFTVQQAQTLTLPACSGGSEPRYARPVSTSGFTTFDGVHKPVIDAALQEQQHLVQQRQEMAAIQHRLAQLQTMRDIRIFLYNQAAAKKADAEAEPKRRLRENIMEDVRQKQALRVQIIELDAKIDALNRLAFNHQVH